MPIQIIGGATVLFRNNELPKQILTNNIRNIYATKKTDICEIRMELEWNIPVAVQ